MRRKQNLIALRLTEQEHHHLMNLSGAESLSISEYIRRRLFDDHVMEPEDEISEEVTQTRDEHDKNIMRTALTTYILAKNLAKSQLPEQQYKEAMQHAKETLKEWGYE